MGYQWHIWQGWLAQAQGRQDQDEADEAQPSSRDKLPPILPFVFYHGTREWTVGLSFQDLLALPEPLQPYVLQFSYILLDFSPTSETEIIGHIYLQARLMLMRYILDERLVAHLDEILGLLLGLQEAKTAMEHLKMMIQYLLGGS